MSVRACIAALFLIATSIAPTEAQQRSAQNPQAVPAAGATAAVALPHDYVIGPDDLLSIVFWREAEMSGQVRVRPDGKISMPLVNEVVAVGLTPEQLRTRLEEHAKRFITDPTATVVVLQINSRQVFVVGNVTRPGVYP